MEKTRTYLEKAEDGKGPFLSIELWSIKPTGKKTAKGKDIFDKDALLESTPVRYKAWPENSLEYTLFYGTKQVIADFKSTEKKTANDAFDGRTVYEYCVDRADQLENGLVKHRAEREKVAVLKRADLQAMLDSGVESLQEKAMELAEKYGIPLDTSNI